MNHKKKESNNIVCVIVTFEPIIEKLVTQINTLSAQVSKIIIIDNNSSNNCELDSIEKNTVELIKLEENYGIAYAQNRGMIKAVEQNANFLLLMDQDSLPTSNMVVELRHGFVKNNVIACGPAYIDSRSGKKSFFVIDRNGGPKRIKYTEKPIETAFLISSGTLIKVQHLLAIKGNRSDYFIDHVDTEWTFRARQNGYKLIGMPNAIMYHSLGDSVKKVWFFGIRQVAYHKPIRDYYMFRNTILMIRDVKMTFKWKLHLLWRLLQFAFYFLSFSKNRFRRFRLMLLGILHGVCSVKGKLNVDTGDCSIIPRTMLDP